MQLDREFQADHHATLSLGAAYDMGVGDHYQRLEVEYYVSGTYYTSATLYEIWPIRDGGRTGSLVWCDVLCSAPRSPVRIRDSKLGFFRSEHQSE